MACAACSSDSSQEIVRRLRRGRLECGPVRLAGGCRRDHVQIRNDAKRPAPVAPGDHDGVDPVVGHDRRDRPDGVVGRAGHDPGMHAVVNPDLGERQRANSFIGHAPRFAHRPRLGIRAQQRCGGGIIRIALASARHGVPGPSAVGSNRMASGASGPRRTSAPAPFRTRRAGRFAHLAAEPALLGHLLRSR